MGVFWKQDILPYLAVSLQFPDLSWRHRGVKRFELERLMVYYVEEGFKDPFEWHSAYS